MRLFRLPVCAGLILLGSMSSPASAQISRSEPHIGYVYPAGGRQGTVVEVVVGGQYLDGVRQVLVSGRGVEAEVLAHKKPLSVQQVNRLREKLEEARKKIQGERRGGGFRDFRNFRNNLQQIRQVAMEAGVTEEELEGLAEFRRQRTDPKAQPNPQIEERAMIRLNLDAKAAPGRRELRLITGAGLSNPLCFHVGEFAECQEVETNDEIPESIRDVSLPFVINGQILPGDVDRFSFSAAQGDRLVVAASARELMPYLADAVPGWFQATLALRNDAGREVAYADDFRFHPDPVFFYEIPADGDYVLEIKDALYRGRADFVYRITVGQIPFVTSIFPLGGTRGQKTDLALTGWNLPKQQLTMDATHKEPGTHALAWLENQRLSYCVPFAVDGLHEETETESNDDVSEAQRIFPPVIANGRVDQPGDWDVYAFECLQGGEIIAEVKARRLNSPLDSILRLTTADGHQLAINDDCEDKSAGLTTHHADARLSVTIPEDGLYYLHVGDTQHKGGPDYAYRLHINAQRPDYELRIVPSSINARAGMTVPLTVHALRKDGFNGDIQLALIDPPAGYRLSGGWVPEGHDSVRLTLTVPYTPTDEPVRIKLEGRAEIDGRIVRRTAVPADDLMQAFIYRHLVPAENLMVSVTGTPRFRGAAMARNGGTFRGGGQFRGRGRTGEVRPPNDDRPVSVPVGGTARVPLPIAARSIQDDVELELSDAPEGISIEKVRSGLMAELLLRADAEKVAAGLKGNLIVNAFVQRSFKRPDGTQSPKRRIPVGMLPAIPFQIVAR